MTGADMTAVVGTLKNFVPERVVRATGTMMRMNIDDGDIFLAEFGNGAIGSVQTSFVTVGNYPGIEVRLYGSDGAIITRLVGSSASPKPSRSPPRTMWSSRKSRFRSGFIRKAAARVKPGIPSSIRT
jgi:hypothetical protein